MATPPRKPKHPRKSTGSDLDQPASPSKSHASKRRKTDHVKDDGVAAAFLKKIQAAENTLKADLTACEAHMAREEAEYAAAMERIVNARREAALWRADRIAQCDAIRRELMAQQQDAELAAELSRMRFKEAQETRKASLKERHDFRQERKKKKNAELRKAEEERAARQQPEIIVEPDLCYISDLDDEFMDAEDEPATSISDFDDAESVDSASVHSHGDDYEDEIMANTTARPGKIEVEEGGESDDDLDIGGLSNHSDCTDDSENAPMPSFKSHLKTKQAEARARQELLERQARARAEAEQAYAERERVRREREWRAQQEAARRDQQEKLKREQERIKRERQERTRREFEQQERERQQQQRRAEGSASRRPMDTPNGQAAAAWVRYTTQWSKLQGTGVPGKPTTDAILYFSNIPWPTIRSPRRPQDISKEAVAALVLSTSHSPEKNTKARLRELLLLWHPDKFVGRWMNFVVPADQADVTEGVMAVARIANELLAERSL